MKKVISIAALAAFALAACGGGGGKDASIGASPATDLVLAAGTSTTVPGTLSTDGITLKSAAWTASASADTPETLTLANDKCTTVSKHDFAPQAGGGSSNWQCDLTVSAPLSVQRDASYTLTLTGTDANGHDHSVTRSIRVTPNPALDPAQYAHAAGADITVAAGQLGTLNCSAPNARWYQWAVTDAAGLPVKLAQASGAQTYFTAPVVPTDTSVTFECRAAVQDRVFSSRVKATVSAATTNTLVVSANGPTVVPFGASSFNASAQWLSPQGLPVDGTPASFSWSAPTGLPAGVAFGQAGGLASVSIGTSTLPALVGLRVIATADGKSSETRLTSAIAPVAATALVSPTLSPAAQTVKSGDTVKVSVAGVNTAQWAVVSGPAIALGGQSTTAVSFTAPSVSAPADIVLRAAVGYGPQSADVPFPGFVDALVHVTP